MSDITKIPAQVLIADLVAAFILIFACYAVFFSAMPLTEFAKSTANIMIGSSGTYLFTEQIVNGARKKNNGGTPPNA